MFDFHFDLSRLAWPWRRKPHVLVVDDDHAVHELMSDAAKAYGIGIKCVTSAEQAKGILDDNGKRFVCIFIDVQLPGKNGWKLQSELHKLWPDLPICVMSADIDNLRTLPTGVKVSVLVKGDNYADLFREIKSKL